jgi:imidazole glycerol-phosphate synthase subunit HisH
MITIVNYGSGNIRAITNIYDKINVAYKIASSPEELKDAQKLILPGVGAFDETMNMLNQSGLRTELDSLVLTQKVPILGICVGMQILGKSSDEGQAAGLGWIDGTVKKFDISKLNTLPKIPHLGWNAVERKKESDLYRNVDMENGFYFIHSFYFECHDAQDMLTETFYGAPFASSVNRANIYGVQFHPEKSHHNGVELLRNFAELPC